MPALRFLRSAAALAMMAAFPVEAAPISPTGSSYPLPPGPPGPPLLNPRPGDRPPLPPQRLARPHGGRGALPGLIGMMDGVEMERWSAVDDFVTSTGNENFWLSDMELSARAVVKPAPAAQERLAGR